MKKVLQVYKNGAEDEFNNNGPSSLLSQYAKMLERLFDPRIERFDMKHNISFDSQFGLRAGRTPGVALLSLIENITASLDANKHADGVYMDIKKGFDGIDDNIFLKIISHYTIIGIVGIWINNYLENSSHDVQFNGMKKVYAILHVVFHKSLLFGLKLILLYINDIYNVQSCLTSFFVLIVRIFYISIKILMWCVKLYNLN